jgi:hypothetical protein
MAYKSTKTEMKGTGGGRWMTRAEAKTGSDKGRRQADKAAVDEQQDVPDPNDKNRPTPV